MARPHVPQFGKWEADQNVAYTVYFDKARKGRDGKMVNPNDPQQNPEAFGNRASPAPPTRTQNEQNAQVRPTHERRASREDRDLKHGYAGRRADGTGEGNRRTPSRASIGSENSIERSPLHPQYQPKKTGRGTTPGRTGHMGRNDDLDKGATIPAFGDWDPSNPSSGAGFTTTFDNARKEKHTGSPNIITETHDYGRSSHNNYNGHKQKAKSGCFSWLR